MKNNNVPIVELINITKRFGDREVLKGIDLKIYDGDLITIMGKSGSGKSTLLNILGFFETQTEGEYCFYGKAVKNDNEKSELRNKYMGFVFQSYNLISQLTVYENIVLPAYYSIEHRKIKERVKNVEQLLKKYDLENIRESYVENISGGEKQRVGMARAMVCDAGIIIADEPTGNLDEKNKSAVLNIFKEMNEQGKTIIIVTHDNDVEKIAKTKLYLDGGVLHKV